jgi:hypothetical protein
MVLADDLPRKSQDEVLPLRATRYVRSWRIGIARPAPYWLSPATHSMRSASEGAMNGNPSTTV